MKIGARIDTTEEATRLSHLCPAKFRVVATKPPNMPIGDGFLYSIPTDEVRSFHRQVYQDLSVIACKGRRDDGWEVVYAKLRKR